MNWQRLILAIIGVIVLFLAICVAAYLVSPQDDDSPPTENVVEYDYEFYATDFFYNEIGYKVSPKAGYKYVVLELRAHNVNYPEYNTNILAWTWKAVADGVVYTNDLDAFAHPDFDDPDLLPGGTGDTLRLFQVPMDTDINSVTFRQSNLALYGDGPNMLFNAALIP